MKSEQQLISGFLSSQNKQMRYVQLQVNTENSEKDVNTDIIANEQR